MKILFMGTPEFALPCLSYLHHCKHELVAVVTQPDQPKGRGKKYNYSPVKQYALDNDMIILQPQKVKSDSFKGLIEQMELDLIVVTAFGQILPQWLLELPTMGCLNVHASLLPKYRGAAPIHRAVIAGEQETGITTMWMDTGLDTGHMFLQRSIRIGKEDTTGIVHDKLAQLGAELLEESICLIEQNNLIRIPQDNENATYAHMLTKEDEKIDWAASAEEISNRVRGMSPWPGTYTYYKGKRIKLLEVKLLEWENELDLGQHFKPGEIISWVDRQGPIIQTGKGYVVLTLLQPAGKKIMGAESYHLGNPFELRTILSSNQGENDL